MNPSVQVEIERRRLATPFVISRDVFTHAQLLVVTLRDGDHVGRGECEPHESDLAAPALVQNQIEAAVAAIGIRRLDRAAVAAALPASPARNALDCALWDLEAKRAGRPVASLAGIGPLAPLATAFTLSIDTPARMADAAARAAAWRLLKIKLGGGDRAGDLDRLRAIRAARPEVRLIVDANGGWTFDLLTELAPALADLGVALIEQPLPPGQDAPLAHYAGPVPLCADESCTDRGSLAPLIGRYHFINIKLDKTGGLTEALALAQAARAAGLGIMVGCNVGSSLAIAPACVVAQDAAFIDLDGPLLLGSDRPQGLRYADGLVHPPEAALWG